MNSQINVSIICSNCSNTTQITNPSLFFNSDAKKCINCNALIETGAKGIDEQILLSLKKGNPAVQSIILCRTAKSMSLQSAKQYVEFMAKQNGIPVNTGVNRNTILIVAIALSVLSMGITMFVVSMLTE
jgi:hypothetical protein